MEADVGRGVFGSVRDDAATGGITSVGIDDVTSTVFVIDADISVRETLAPLIRTAGWEPESFASAEEFLAHPRGTNPCCLILDLALPGLSGLELQNRLAGRPEIPIIFVTSCTNVPMTVQAMKAGAAEFLTKPVNDVALLHAIGAALKWSRAALRRDSEMRMLWNRYASLTRRQRQVMTLVVSGLLNKQIGDVLGISEITVKAHRGQVMRKMQADSLPHLVTVAVQLGLQHPTSRSQSSFGIAMRRASVHVNDTSNK